MPASVRMKADTACYPKTLNALFVKTAAASSSCEISLVEQWNGPYTKDARSDGMRTEQEIDQHKIKRVKKAPVGGRRARRRNRPPEFAEGKAITANDAQSKIVIRNLVENTRQFNNRIAHRECDSNPQ